MTDIYDYSAAVVCPGRRAILLQLRPGDHRPHHRTNRRSLMALAPGTRLLILAPLRFSPERRAGKSSPGLARQGFARIMSTVNASNLAARFPLLYEPRANSISWSTDWSCARASRGAWRILWKCRASGAQAIKSRFLALVQRTPAPIRFQSEFLLRRLRYALGGIDAEFVFLQQPAGRVPDV